MECAFFILQKYTRLNMNIELNVRFYSIAVYACEQSRVRVYFTYSSSVFCGYRRYTYSIRTARVPGPESRTIRSVRIRRSALRYGLYSRTEFLRVACMHIFSAVGASCMRTRRGARLAQATGQRRQKWRPRFMTACRKSVFCGANAAFLQHVHG